MGSWRQLCKPSTSSLVSTTVKNSPNPSSVISGYANTGKKFSIAFIKYFSREKRKTLCLGD